MLAALELVGGIEDKADIEDLLPDAVRLAVQVGDLATADSVTARVESHVDSAPGGVVLPRVAGPESGAAAGGCRSVRRRRAASWDSARLAAVQRAAGIRRGPRVTHRKAGHGWESLTPTESTIAALVVSGMTNRQIAAKLFLSPRTDIAREAARRSG